MNTFTAATSRGSRAATVSRLSRLTPKWKPKLATLWAAARRFFSASASRLSVAGRVLGMSMKLVMPPATAARDSLAIEPFCG